MASNNPTQRLKRLLEKLGEQGISQAQVAIEVGVRPQYLNDVLGSRRRLNELMARRIGEKFGVDFSTLLARHLAPEAGASGAADAEVVLPLVPHPVEGNPRLYPRWDGTFIQVPPIARATLAAALFPYVLRYGEKDVEMRLHKTDLVLVSQRPVATAPIVVARTGKKCFLVRRKSQRWVRLANGVVLGDDVVVVGHCVSVLWSALT